MKIGVSSQNFRTITGHAGKGRRFFVYQVDADGEIHEQERLDLPKEMAMHTFAGDDHPLDRLDVLITGGCGQGFVRKMAARGVRVVPTGETDPLRAVRLLASGAPLAPPKPRED